MRTQVFGLSGDRSKAANVAIIITDGNPTIMVSEMAAEVQMAQSQGITMVAVGITNAINENVLRSLSSPPKQVELCSQFVFFFSQIFYLLFVGNFIKFL